MKKRYGRSRRTRKGGKRISNVYTSRGGIRL
ncbi:MAG: hypothetical protein [Arizlama microvirus]|nr:MAG: hypothetical protein [Arizlama microvirus]